MNDFCRKEKSYKTKIQAYRRSIVPSIAGLYSLTGWRGRRRWKCPLGKLVWLPKRKNHSYRGESAPERAGGD